MKNLITIIFSFAVMAFQSCASQTYMDKTTIQQVVDNEQFTFMAERANPTNYDVINIANSIPNYGSGRMFNLDYGYTLVLKNKELIATLPYFGRSFSGNRFDNDKQSLRFTSKDYTIEKSISKKGNQNLKIKPNDVNHINTIYIEIYKNGRAIISIDANDRQPISFDGYLMKNEELKK